MSDLIIDIPEIKPKRKYTKSGLHSKKYKEFKAKGKKVEVTQEEPKCSPKVNKWVDTSDPKYHNFEEHSTFKRCNGCGSVLRIEVTGCQYCVRKDRQG